MPEPPVLQPSFLRELSRRRVLRVAAAYAVVAWAVVQVADVVFPALELPDWALRLVVVLALLGFPVALVLAWAFDVSPEGVRREPRASAEPAGAPAARRVQRLAALGLAIAMAAALIGSFALLQQRAPAPAEFAATAAAHVLEQLTFSAGVEEYAAFSPDGARLAFSREIDGYKQLYIRSLQTGQEERLTDGPRDHIQPAWSPDGQTLLYVRARAEGGKLQPGDVFGAFNGGDIWRLELPTRQRRAILENAYNPAFSHDGGRVAFDAAWTGPHRIWTADAHGRNPEQLTSDESEAVAHVAPAWSPDGRHVAFQSLEKTKLDIRLVDTATRAMTWLTDDLSPDVEPAWAPGEREVFFSSYRGGGLNIWRISVSMEGRPAGPPRQITTGAGQDLSVAVSPDGARLAFTILSQNADLWRLPLTDEGAAAGAPERLIATTREDSRGAWSPDGRQLAFNSDRGGEMNLWVYSLEDGQTRQLTSGSGGDYQPRWSPDGRSLVFFSSRAGNADIWSVNVATGELRQLTAEASIDVNPFFSPAGGSIAFQSDRGGRNELWLMGADGSGARPLTVDGAGGHFVAWAPDARSLLVNLRGTGIARVFLDGSPPRVHSTVRGGSHLSLSPDGSAVMDVVGHRTLWLSPLEGADPRYVFEFEDTEFRIDYPVWSPDGRWVLFDGHKPTGGDVWLLDLRRIARPVT